MSEAAPHSWQEYVESAIKAVLIAHKRIEMELNCWFPSQETMGEYEQAKKAKAALSNAMKELYPIMQNKR